MTIISALPSPAKASETGSYRLSAVTANVADGDSIEVDGPIATNDSGEPIAWANVPSGGARGSVQSGPSETEVTVNHNAGAATDVTVFALVE